MLKYAKILNELTKEVSVALGSTPPLDYTEMEVEQSYDGNWYIQGYAPQEPAPTEEEQREKRSIAYKNEIDPITSHIQRLRDEEQTEEVIAEIEALIAEREAKVEEIKQRYPYPVGN